VTPPGAGDAGTAERGPIRQRLRHRQSRESRRWRQRRPKGQIPLHTKPRQQPGRVDRVSALRAMARFARISAARGGARRSRRHRPPRERQPMTSLQSNGVRSRPAGSLGMRGAVSSRTPASLAPAGGAVAFHVLQRERRSANTSLPADLPTKTAPGARRATASADTESFPVGVRATPAIGTRGEFLD
jgi:hypothetical protein